ncbi:hypothetical protein TWF102_006945 [Orbilia oligospora]|uniref:Uncharacterized protein n=1 Tax=Orbilia oligospora TaxID=2813651 RepID=A0A7C8JGI4_ORBOL|nr:hypothetical protein TWF103_005818 [Orbilia oligospora]KAF3111271.1 hypothetical protein TWF102_006945 [Orbilia oligospora]KAF3114261.1 hypothetical protein TWF706_008198 [Orbilia oligospora]
MLVSSRFNLLVVALVAFVSFVTARTVITSQTCATRYCGSPPKKPYRITKTIRKSIPYTKVRWKTVIKPRITRTVTSTKTVTSQRYFTVWKTFSTSTLANTIWIGTTTHTRTVHATLTITTATVTLPTFTSTITTPSITVPAPSGFLSIEDDPMNFGVGPDDDNDPNWPWWAGGEKRRREAQPDPAAAENKYVTAVTCTKILITKTGTSDLWKTTTKAASTTTKTVLKTKTALPPVITTTKTTTEVQLITTSKYKVAFFSSIFTRTLTSYTDTTVYLSTVSTSLPAPTYYAACGNENRAPNPDWWDVYHIDGGNAVAGETTKVIFSNGTSYKCCEACHTYNEGGATCAGSAWSSLTEFGEQPCQEPPVGSRPCPEFTTRCELVIVAPDAPVQCPRRQFKFVYAALRPPRIISNGPTCARFSFYGFSEEPWP